jgi:hypothetical protein
MARASVERKWASTQRAVGPAQESQDEGLAIRNMNRGADVLCFSIAVSPQEDVGLGRSMRYPMPPAAGEDLVPLTGLIMQGYDVETKHNLLL